MHSNDDHASFHLIHTETETDYELFNAVRFNHIKTAENLLKNGANPLLLVPIEVSRRIEGVTGVRKVFSRFRSDEIHLRISIDVPILFLAKNDEMKALLFVYTNEFIHDENVKNKDIEHLYHLLLEEMRPDSIALMVSFLIDEMPNKPSTSQLKTLELILKNIVSSLPNRSYTLDNFEINHSILTYLRKGYRDKVILQLLYQSSTDLQQRTFIDFLDDKFLYSPLSCLLIWYGQEILSNNSTENSYHTMLHQMLNYNYILWNDLKNNHINNIDASMYDQLSAGERSAFLAGLKGLYKLFNISITTQYFKLLNTCQMIYLICNDMSLPYNLPTELIAEITKKISILSLSGHPKPPLDIIKSLNERVKNQTEVIKENAILKIEMDFFIEIYNINNNIFSTHSFVEEQKQIGSRPQKFLRRAESHARDNPTGLTAKTLAKANYYKMFPKARKDLKQNNNEKIDSKNKFTKK